MLQCCNRSPPDLPRPTVWWFRVWRFKRRHSKLVTPLGKHLWKPSNFFQFCIIEESQASECGKIEFLKSEVMKFWEQNSNSWLKTMHKTSPNFWNWWTVVVTRADLEIGTTPISKFSKFDLTPKFHLFSWLENTPYFNFRFKNDGITGT